MYAGKSVYGAYNEYNTAKTSTVLCLHASATPQIDNPWHGMHGMHERGSAVEISKNIYFVMTHEKADYPVLVLVLTASVAFLDSIGMCINIYYTTELLYSV